jgi:hypothetical protein
MPNSNGTINVASLYSKKLEERFSIGSKTNAFAGKKYDFVGTKSVEIITADRMEMVDYTRTGTSRYGTIYELGDTKQTLTMTKDRAFTFSIDAANASDQFNIKQANARLKDHWDGVVTPEVDKYRLNAWATGHGLSTGKSILYNATPAALSEDNIIGSIFNAAAAMSDELVPATNRVLFIGELDYVKLQLADVVIGGSQLNANAVAQGYKGMLDGIKIVTVPSSYMPQKTGFILKWKGATVDPIKLKTLRVQKTPLGIDGDVVEGHIYYDSFVLDAKCKGVYAWKTQAWS